MNAIHTATAINPQTAIRNSQSTHRIHISSQYIFDAASCMAPEDARAVKWFAGYARLLNRTGDAFQEELGLDAIQIRDCLTSPDADPTLRARFTGAVEILREKWEARLAKPHTTEANPFPRQTPFHSALGKLARTQPVTETRKAVIFAEAGGWAVTEGLERMGKTVSAANAFLQRLDTAAWIRVPSGDSLVGFLLDLARAVGLTTNNRTEQVSRLKARIATVLGPGKIETLFLDQFHAVLPVNAGRSYPARLELLMDWVDELGVNIVGIATPQWGSQLEALGANSRYRSGQAIGRIKMFRLRETLTDTELAAIAKSREPELNDKACELLVLHAKTSKGYCGSLMNTLARFRQIFADQDARDRGLSDDAWRTKAAALAVAEDTKGAAK